jgi:hypothetical protein
MKNEGIFQKKLEELKHVIDTEKLTCRNEGLLMFNLKKEEKKCEILKDILSKKGNSKYLSQPVSNEKPYELKTLIRNYNDLRVHQIEKENKFKINCIFDSHNEMISEIVNSDAYELNDILNKIKEIILAFIPLIEKDQLITQDIYDCISAFTEKYKENYNSFTVNQYNLKLKLNETNPMTKITIDDRDTFNLFISRTLKDQTKSQNLVELNEKQWNQNDISKEIFDFNFYLEKFNLFEKNTKLSNKMIYNKFLNFNEEIVLKLTNLYQAYSHISKQKEFLLGRDFLLKKNSMILENNSLREKDIQISTEFVLKMKKTFGLKEENSLNMFDIIYFYLFNQKQLSNILKIK